MTTLTPDEREAYEERAAIMEYDGKMSRAKAERLAMVDILKIRLLRELEAPG